ncbi:MAG TPA: alpha/beta hydrolase [Candidatus Kapabacteria bacterium]|nr:alpha/beta hydrolase [Candidatus Kapabacteria bacterium]
MITEEIRVQVNGMELAAKQWGDPELPAIIALHGWLDNAASYDRLSPALTQHRVIALDFAGHGYSGHRPEGVRYHTIDNVDDVIGLADALGLQEFILMGHSMGAGIATFTAGSFPERVTKLILIEGIGSNTNPAEDAPRVLRKAVEDMKKTSAKRKPVYETRDDAIHTRAHAIGVISVDASTHICNRGLMPAGEGFTWRSDPRLKMSSAIRLTEDMVTAYLQKLTMPVLLVRGRHSFFATEKTLQNRADKIPGCQQVLLDGNHHLHLEAETFAPVAEAINGFLAA